MVLNEPIQKVFQLEYREELLQNWQNSYLHLHGAFEYHTTEGYWLLLETENHYATIGFDGVQIYPKPHVFPEDRFTWWYDGDDAWPDHLHTLLFGQRLHTVEVRKDCQLLSFDAFTLTLYTYTKEDGFSLGSGSFSKGIRTLALGSHLLKKCICGGSGELLCDECGDFAARCKLCHRATCFDMVLKNQINAWNNDDTPSIVNTAYESLLQLFAKQKNIAYFALSSHEESFLAYDDSSCDCSSVIIAFDDGYFLLSSQKSDSNHFEFSGSPILDYNRDFWAKEIRPLEHLSFLREETDWENRKFLIFQLDDTDLIIEATCDGLSVSLDEILPQLSPEKIQRKALFVKQ